MEPNLIHFIWDRRANSHFIIEKLDFFSDHFFLNFYSSFLVVIFLIEVAKLNTSEV